MLDYIATKIIHQLPVFSTGFGRYAIANKRTYRVRNSLRAIPNKILITQIIRNQLVSDFFSNAHT